MNKPLSLKEKLALKTQQAAAKKEEATTVSTSTQAAVVAATEIKKEASAKAVAVVEDTTPHSVIDLRPKIAELADLSGEDLTNAMKELKAALMQNPSAVELMLPEDIGAMVASLRKITGQELVAATTKKGKKEKAKVLSKEEMEAAFDEL